MTKSGGRKILGIDPGIATTGWGLVEKQGNKFALVDFGTITTPACDPHSARLVELHEKLNQVIKKYSPAVVAVEELFFAKNVKTAIAVGQARGVILLTVKENHLPLLEFTPLEVKQAITGFGRATKKQIQNMVKILLGLKVIPRPDDAADALAIAICGANSERMYQK